MDLESNISDLMGSINYQYNEFMGMLSVAMYLSDYINSEGTLHHTVVMGYRIAISNLVNEMMNKVAGITEAMIAVVRFIGKYGDEDEVSDPGNESEG